MKMNLPERKLFCESSSLMWYSTFVDKNESLTSTSGWVAFRGQSNNAKPTPSVWRMKLNALLIKKNVGLPQLRSIGTTMNAGSSSESSSRCSGLEHNEFEDCSKVPRRWKLFAMVYSEHNLLNLFTKTVLLSENLRASIPFLTGWKELSIRRWRIVLRNAPDIQKDPSSIQVVYLFPTMMES